MPPRPPAHSKQNLVYTVAITLGLVVVALIALAYLRSSGDAYAPLKTMKTYQEADAPLGYSLPDDSQPPFDNRFIQLNAFQRAQLPTVSHMQQPMGSRQGALTYNAQRYWDDNPKRGGRHTGDDINGIGGMNTDLDDPVYASAHGVVVYRGEPSPGWGKILITAHRLPDGSIQQFMYSHLHQSAASLGDKVARGQIIGSVGTANLNYPAHLHFESRNTSGVWIGRGYLKQPAEHTNPTETIAQWADLSPASLHPVPARIIDQELTTLQRNNITIGKPDQITK